jgi:hypothetical protein
VVPAVYVIDDFLPDPEALRARALGLTYRARGNYPGRDSLERLPIDGLDDAVSAIMRQRFRAQTLASDDQVAGVHVDPSHLSGILYLSSADDCRGGTEFFRHIRTGTDRMPMRPEELSALGYSSYGEMHQDVVGKEGRDRTKWQKTMGVPMRFNRLVLLQPHYWHTAGPGFGDGIENGRLVYLMFFKVAA